MTVVVNNIAETIQGQGYPNVNGYSRCASGIIQSRLVNGVWVYSNSQMVVECQGSISNNNAYYGLKFENALPTYVSSSDAASTRFTRTGGSENVVE